MECYQMGGMLFTGCAMAVVGTVYHKVRYIELHGLIIPDFALTVRVSRNR